MTSMLNNIVITNVLSILSRVFQFLLALVITNKLGTKAFGEFSTANTTLVILMTFISFGSNFLINREVAKNNHSGYYFLSNIFIIKFFMYILIMICLLAFKSYIPFSNITNKLVVIFTVSLIFRSVTEQIWFYYQALEKFPLYSLMLFLPNFLLFSISFAAMEINPKTDIVTIAYFFLCIQIFFLLINLCIIFKWYLNGDNLKVEINFRDIKEIFIKSFPFFVSAGIGILYNKIDILMIATLKNEIEVGYYSISYTLYESLLIIPITVATVIFPRLLNTKQIKDQKKLISKSIYHLIHLTIIIGVGVTLFSKEIIYLLFSPEQKMSVLCLQILIWGLLVQSFSNILGRIIYAYNNEKAFIKIGLISLCSNILINIVLIPIYGIYGASIATIVSFIISAYLQYKFVRSYFDVKIFVFDKPLLVLVALFTISSYIVLLLKLNIIIDILFLTMVYIFLINLLNIVDIRTMSRSLFRKRLN